MPCSVNANGNFRTSPQLEVGFVREKKDENELCICIEQYSDDLSDDNWLLLEDVFK